MPSDLATLYLDLMKRSLTNTIYDDPDFVRVAPRGWAKRVLVAAFARSGISLMRERSAEGRASGRQLNPRAHTMIGLKRLDNIQRCVESVLAESVPGDLAEAGVWRGGASCFMRAILKAHGVTDRKVWLADSFRGLPPPDSKNYPGDEGDMHHTISWLAVPIGQVKQTFERYGLLDSQVEFLEGWFKDTLPTAPIERLAVLRVDGDMYESTIEVLENLYPKLSPGGYVILDDWGDLPMSRKAVEDFRKASGVEEPIQDVDGIAVYWRKR